jgi:hypothetical protein
LLIEVIGRSIIDDGPRMLEVWGWRKLLAKLVGPQGQLEATVGQVTY